MTVGRDQEGRPRPFDMRALHVQLGLNSDMPVLWSATIHSAHMRQCAVPT